MLSGDEHFDVVVVGGGPGGATAATFIAMQGHRVLLLEKEVYPLYKIGESLLPSTVHGICTLLGVGDELRRANFVHKRGGTFRWGKNKEPWTFAFSDSSTMQSPTSFAYQVERMKFDLILLNNAKRKGVDVREQHRVTDVICDAGRVCGLECKSPDGARKVIRSRYVIDASGHTSAVARHLGERVHSEFFRNIALFGYYLNGKRLSSPSSGNIFCAAFDKGWFWYIPLSETLTSVGAVIGEEYAELLRNDHASALGELIASCQPIHALLKDAVRVCEGPYGTVRVRKDYSYCHSKFWGPGMALVGDAACFVDPVFSSGVHLATYSGLLVARSVNTCLDNRANDKVVSEERAFNEFEARYRREYRLFYDFLLAFYDMNQDLGGYYWAARTVTNSKERGNDAFIQLVSGVAGSEPLYKSAADFLEVRQGIGKRLFPAADGLTSDMYVESGVGSIQRDRFMRDLVTEGAQVQLQGALNMTFSHATPLIENGLVPSKDGFHWVEPFTRRAGHPQALAMGSERAPRSTSQ